MKTRTVKGAGIANLQLEICNFAAGNKLVRRDRNGLTRCRVCGCTEVDACAEGCGWVRGEPDLCTGCAAAANAILDWINGARRPNRAALWREVMRQLADLRAGKLA